MNRQNLGQFLTLRPGGPNVSGIVGSNQYNFNAMGPSRFWAFNVTQFPQGAVVGFVNNTGTLSTTRLSTKTLTPPLGVVANDPAGEGTNNHLIQVFGQVTIPAAQFDSDWVEPGIGELVYLGQALGKISHYQQSPNVPIGIWMGDETVHLNPAG